MFGPVTDPRDALVLLSAPNRVPFYESIGGAQGALPGWRTLRTEGLLVPFAFDRSWLDFSAGLADEAQETE